MLIKRSDFCCLEDSRNIEDKALTLMLKEVYYDS